MCKGIRSSCSFLSFVNSLLILAFAFVSFSPVIASAAQVTLAWDENDEADLVGYMVYCRQEGQAYDYYNPAWDGVENTCTIEVNDNTTYYFVARAYDIYNYESGNSNEACYRPEKNSMVISQSGWSVLSVDSEQVDRENEAENAFDGDPMTHWHTQWRPTISPLPHELQIDLGDVYDIAGFRYLPRQDVGVNGRIGQYEFFVSMDGVNWDSCVASGVFQNDATEKEVLFSYPATGQFIRLVALTEANGGPWTSMAELNLLSTAEVSLGISPAIRTLAVGEMVSFTASGGAPPYTFNLEVDNSGATLIDNGDGTADYIAGLTPGNDIVCVTDDLGTTVDAQVIVTKASMVISHSGWSVLSVDSEQLAYFAYNKQFPGHEAEKAFDGDPMTHWHTQWRPTISPLPHELQIDLGDVYDIAGFRYLPRQDTGVNGRIGQYEFFVSMDGVNWDSCVASGVFQNDATEKEVLFSYPATGQFIRLVALTEANGGPWTSMAELNILSSN